MACFALPDKGEPTDGLLDSDDVWQDRSVRFGRVRNKGSVGEKRSNRRPKRAQVRRGSFSNVTKIRTTTKEAFLFCKVGYFLHVNGTDGTVSGSLVNTERKEAGKRSVF